MDTELDTRPPLTGPAKIHDARIMAIEDMPYLLLSMTVRNISLHSWTHLPGGGDVCLAMEPNDEEAAVELTLEAWKSDLAILRALAAVVKFDAQISERGGWPASDDDVELIHCCRLAFMLMDMKPSFAATIQDAADGWRHDLMPFSATLVEVGNG